MDTIQHIDQHCRRGSAREAVSLAGSALGFARSRSVIVSDISPTGAQLDARDLPPPGDDLFVVVGPFDTMATVIWRTNEKAGVEFESPASDELLARMKREANWESVTGWFR
jgi:PilZ domain